MKYAKYRIIMPYYCDSSRNRTENFDADSFDSQLPTIFRQAQEKYVG